MGGLYFEELEEGLHVLHPITRTVTETDNLLLTALTHNPQPLHLDAEFCRGTEFGRILVNSMFTLALTVGLTVSETTLGTTVANLGLDEVRFPSPVFIGDTLRAETRVRSRRESKSRPTAGIVVFEHRAINQRGQDVVVCLRSALMLKRPAG
jgi:acyl dehydratase